MSNEKKDSPLTFGFLVSADQLPIPLDWQQVDNQEQPHGDQWRWLHFDREFDGLKQWIDSQVGASDIVSNALLQADTRPRVVKYNDGFLMNLRGVNLNPGSAPEDMVSLRVWITEHQVITMCARRVLAAEDLRDAFLSGSAPPNIGGVVTFLTDRLIARIDPVVTALQDKLDDMEEQLLNSAVKLSTSQLIGFRRSVLGLRRYIAPQREALTKLITHGDSILIDNDRHQLSDTLDRLIRLAEDLDLIRERAMLQHEQLVAERTDSTNDRLFILALISAIFLPLSIVTGLFGVNVGGMPGVDSPFAFVFLCAGMLVLSLLIVLTFKRKHWI